MKERKFLKELNNKNNEDGSFTYTIVSNLIESSDNKPVHNNLFNKIMSKFFRVKSYEQILSENFEEILSKTDSDHKCSLLTLFIDNPTLEHIIKDDFTYIIENLNQEEFYLMKNFLDKFRDNKVENIEFIENNIDQIVSNINPTHLFEATKSMKGISENIDNILNEQLEKNKSEVIFSILDESTKYRPTEIEDKREEMLSGYVKTLEIMFDEVLTSEDKRMIDINEVKGGAYSSVYEIGDKILKVGGTRATYNIPNHRRILQPLTRIELIDEKDRRALGCVEITNKVERNLDRDEEDEEKLYSIWKELREDGIIWTDIKSANIGKLKESNKPTLNNEEMYVAPNSVGFDRELEEEPLGSEEWVIIDTDYIYSKDDYNIVWTTLSKKFEKRYQQDYQSKIAQKYKEDSNNIKESKTQEKIK